MSEPVVRISGGFLKGTAKKAVNGNPFHSFEGIPFAQPPVGALRFKAPVPVKPWQGIRDASSQGPPNYCPDLRKKTESGEIGVDGSEDCLYLNVFTPSLPHDKYELKPVMVFIHGGAFVRGGTQEYGPEVYLTEDVVLVTTSYRLGALGFLAIDDPKLGVTGNAALKDMVLALKWIQQHIKAFNGDPNNVTIFGESAGAAAVHYLVLSPIAKGLFHKAIIASGASLCHWATGNPQNGVILAKKLGCIDEDAEKILEFLQNVAADELVRAQLSLSNKMAPSTVRLFAPVVETPNAQDAFLTEDPIDILVSGKYNHVPIIFGFNSDEAAIFTLPMFARDDHVAEKNIVPFRFNLEIGSEEYTGLAKKIRAFYLKDGTDTTEEGVLSENGKQLAADLNFLRPLIQSAKLHLMSSEESIYIYRLSVVTKLAFLSGGKGKGVCHADDLGYQFILPNTPEVSPGSIEDISRKRIVTLFTNFAKHGNPNPNETCDLFPIKWEPIEEGGIKLLDIGENLAMEVNPEAESMQFWDQTFQSYDHTKYY